MIILHGNDITLSRNYLHNLIQKAKSNNQDIIKFEAGKIDLTDLKQALSSNSLFGRNNLLIIIYSLFSLPQSNLKNNLLLFLQQKQNSPIILWENKQISPAKLKIFPQAQTQLFKINPLIFKFLEQLGSINQSQNLKNLLKHDSAAFIFAMLTRQIRLLIQAKSNPSSLKLAPWQINRLKTQSNYFTLEKLLQIHEKLYLIDKNLKTGKLKLDLSYYLDNLFS